MKQARFPKAHTDARRWIYHILPPSLWFGIIVLLFLHRKEWAAAKHLCFSYTEPTVILCQ